MGTGKIYHSERVGGVGGIGGGWSEGCMTPPPQKKREELMHML